MPTRPFNRGDGKDTITDYGFSSHTHSPGYSFTPSQQNVLAPMLGANIF